ncbi:hypothetical protein, partial [Staphylococcus epidermidis]|uniref:hypothetical protein n=1 Tax=Staphylococcus epidermidis TaxID=1282 RepID=UPI001C92F042
MNGFGNFRMLCVLIFCMWGVWDFVRVDFGRGSKCGSCCRVKLNCLRVLLMLGLMLNLLLIG